MYLLQRMVKAFARSVALGAVLVLAACGGGSGSNNVATTATFPASAASINDPNVTAITVERGPGNNVNIPYVSVTLCVPGTTTCKTIDHVLLDTGSTGLRLFASAVNAVGLVLPAHQIGGSSTISECAQFLNSLAWGTVKVADVVIGSKRAVNVPVQLMDANYPTVLDSVCQNNSLPVMVAPGTSGSNVTALSANGILGTSLYAHDGQNYFNCTTSTACQITPVANLQVQNPVSLFTGDNNGVVVQLPALPDAGVTSANGYLIFGIATQSNNQLGSANIVPVNAFGYFTTIYNGRTLPTSFMDSGSNGLYFNDASLSASCNSAATGFYCPASTRPLSAGIRLAGANVATVNFSIASADSLFRANNYAFNNLGGTLDNTSFDWGLPFFFGRSVYTAIEGKTAGSQNGPFYAFTN